MWGMQSSKSSRSDEKKKKQQYMFLAFLIAIFLSNVIPVHTVDDELVPYVQDYKNLVRTFCREDQLYWPTQTRIKIQSIVIPTMESAVGVCINLGNFFDIRIKKNFWNQLGSDAKVELMYHELSHCILGLSHRDNPLDYMYPSLTGIPKNMIEQQVLEDAWNLCIQK